MEHKLDTTGVIDMEPGEKVDRGHLISWSDLSPFTQGYVEALFAAHSIERTTGDGRVFSHGAFDMLAPETLARVIADCAAIMAAKPALYDQIHDGKMVWKNRQAGFGGGFESLTVQLGEDGKLRFAA